MQKLATHAMRWAHVDVVAGHAVHLKSVQCAVEQQLGNQVVEAAHDDAELHVRLGHHGAMQLAGGLEGGKGGAPAHRPLPVGSAQHGACDGKE